jgi:hypothetical protein
VSGIVVVVWAVAGEVLRARAVIAQSRIVGALLVLALLALKGEIPELPTPVDVQYHGVSRCERLQLCGKLADGCNRLPINRIDDIACLES